MAKVIFWEKPGCTGNKRQKIILEQAGHELEVRNLLTETWTRETLRSFFGSLPVSRWFNMTNPDIKAGRIVPERLGAEEALDMMLAEPLLIRRPLMQAGESRLCGFAAEEVHGWIGLDTTDLENEDPQACPHPQTSCD